MCSTVADKVSTIVGQFRDTPGSLIPILHAIQEEYGYLSRDVQALVASELGISPVKVHGVVSFYSFFTEQAKGEYEIGVCMGTACYVRGAADVLEAFEDKLRIRAGETTADQRFTIGMTRCIGACGLAPVVTVNEDVYGRLTPDRVPELVEKYRTQ